MLHAPFLGKKQVEQDYFFAVFIEVGFHQIV